MSRNISTIITGFVINNIGAITNSVAVGSIEIYSEFYNVNSVNTDAENLYYQAKIGGTTVETTILIIVVSIVQMLKTL